MAAGELGLGLRDDQIALCLLFFRGGGFLRALYSMGVWLTVVAHSRPSLKKYLKANHKNLASSDAVFDTQFNKAIKSGVDKGDFAQPKGTYNLIWIL